MADEYNTSTNWWDRSRFDSGSSSSSSTSGLSFAWPTELRSSMESSVQTPLSDSSVVSHDTQKLQQLSIEDPENLQLMGLGLSSPAIDYQSLLRGREKQEAHHHHHGIGSSQIQWRPERVLFNAGDSSNRGFSLDQPQFSPHGSSSDSTVTCQSFQSMDSSSIVYGGNSNMFQGMLGSDQYGANYGNEMLPNSSNWCSNSKMVPAFLRTSPSNLQQNPTQPHLQFSNNAPFWNASATNIADHIRPGFFPPQPQFASTSFEEKPKVQNISEVREAATVAKKSGSETSTGTTKRPRNESQSTLPPFKVKKEKMGDRITALQQLVSPFGKTDTASVLSEALDYIKFLHEQVSVLSTPYMKSGAPIHHHQQSSDKNKEHEGHKQQDLKSRGLCLVPVSSTFPVTHETVDFWTPTFGGTFR